MLRNIIACLIAMLLFLVLIHFGGKISEKMNLQETPTGTVVWNSDSSQVFIKYDITNGIKNASEAQELFNCVDKWKKENSGYKVINWRFSYGLFKTWGVFLNIEKSD